MTEKPKLRVIYAEDDASVRNLISTFLLDEAIDIHACDNAAEAVRLAATIAPNVVILDLAMPDMDGFQAAHLIRERDPFGHIRVVALTGLESPDILKQAARAGFDEFIKKPVSGKTLLSALGLSTDRGMLD